MAEQLFMRTHKFILALAIVVKQFKADFLLLFEQVSHLDWGIEHRIELVTLNLCLSDFDVTTGLDLFAEALAELVVVLVLVMVEHLLHVRADERICFAHHSICILKLLAGNKQHHLVKIILGKHFGVCFMRRVKFRLVLH